MRENLFFPGATHLAHRGPERSRARSRWRETAFMIRQLRRVIVPQLSLGDSIRNWSRISEALSESPRRRQLQGKTIHEVLAGESLS